MEDARNVRLPDPLHTFAIRQSVPALDSGWQTFPGHYLLYASSGVFRLEFETVEWHLPPQRAAWIERGTRVRIRADRPITSRSVLFAGDVRDPALPPCRVFAPTPLARELLEYAMRWGVDRDPSDPQAALFFGTLSALCNELAVQPERFWLPRTEDPVFDTLAGYIYGNLQTSLSAAVLAKVANMSERTLSRRFRQTLGMSCGQYVHRARMLRSLELLESREHTVSEVAWLVGFESLSAFISAFRTFTQETPTQYRRRVSGDPLSL